ncbi:hypothetical protein K0U83_17670 [bacterium]|nr:hypothetical protein [bacterium]
MRSLFKEMDRTPVVVSYGLGVDSTAMLIGLHARGIKPDAILFADTGAEKDATYDYLPVVNGWLRSVGWPEVTVVRNTPSPDRLKHWPAYETLESNCTSNATLPSLAYGRKACSLKWKAGPMDKWVRREFATELKGGKVRRLIGYDDSPADRRRFAKVKDRHSDNWRFEYPLIEWGWTRDRCKEVIREAGLPVPPKSACYFCPSTHSEELDDMKTKYLRRIVAIEARAAAHNTKVSGLWRSKAMTDYIRDAELLPADEIDRIIEVTPTERVLASTPEAELPDWHDFLECFTEEDALEEVADSKPKTCGSCEGCTGCNLVSLSL